MITAWSPSGSLWFRRTAGPRRLLLVAMLLFGFVYAHGVSTEAVAHHVAPTVHTGSTPDPDVSATTASPASGQVSAEPDRSGAPQQPRAPRAFATDPTGHGEDAGHEGGHSSTHAPQECVPGQPSQGPALEAPCLSLLPGGAAPAAPSQGSFPRGEVVVPAAGLKDSTGSGVLRI
ncbi:hypothetical protein [Streptomyces sp. HNM0574]|uniref:hypothetical protein n=1 Tax=Streptomyces sp. HNM0574 TaxID=2714954 RepID=UPI00146D24CE|nr:hypothetical protein [Streptomyces sp. HNM0574]NLU68401.1 hypothetical protein [Streptomyces sp. HNM0574]